jgi:hypothetical protein
VRTFNAVAIAPDGRHIAWSVQGMGVSTASTAGMDVRLLPGDGDDHYVPWSPDSTSLATVGDGGKDQRQIFVTHGFAVKNAFSVSSRLRRHKTQR